MSSDPSAPLVNPNQDRLKTHFESHAPAAHAKRWDDLWSDGSFLPWDRGYANPALIDALNERADVLGSPLKSDGSRKRALVPGCGKGYDVALFAAHGYDSFGVEVSESAVRAAEEYLKDPGPGPLEGEYKVKNEEVGRGTAKCLLGDFFEDEDGWIKGTGGLEEGFDIIYDNTVSLLLC
jgi:methyl halide transferase